MDHPFLILSLPRSRSYWLSQFLTYGDRVCQHEPSRHFTGMGDLQAYLSNPKLAAADTAMIHLGRAIANGFPDIRIVTIRRPITDVARSARSLGYPAPKLELALFRADCILDELENSGRSLSFGFDELDDESVCGEIFEYCHRKSVSRAHYRKFAGRNLQCDHHAIMADALRNRAGMAALYGIQA